MFPVKDANRTLTTPYVNHMLIIANVVVFLVTLMNEEYLFSNLAMRPHHIIHGTNFHTLFTSMFLHAGFIHIFGNMLYLYIFGDNVEDVFGHVSYLFFYLTCGLVAGITYIMTGVGFTPDDMVVGASGAISGVLGAYLVLYPKSRIFSMVFYGLPILIPIPAIFFLGFWFLMQWLYAIFDIGSNVAWWAHIGGFLGGLILALIFGLEKKKAREEHRQL
ncbi:MAG: rhomboid family intramembrane serine protease [Candidatus Bathyarchaeota archaeon]